MFFRKPSDHVPHVTIFHTILRSMLWILFIEIALLVGILYLCRINTSLEQNAVDILQIQTENRQNYLQGQMLDAQDLSSLAGKINAVTQAMLDDGEISLDTLDSGSDAASPLLLSIGDSLISSMRHRPVTGIFVVLNTHDLDTRKKGEPLPCLYLRDLDPNSSPSQRNSDLMLVRAPAQVVQSLYIATDTSWTPSSQRQQWLSLSRLSGSLPRKRRTGRRGLRPLDVLALHALRRRSLRHRLHHPAYFR